MRRQAHTVVISRNIVRERERRLRCRSSTTPRYFIGFRSVRAATLTRCARARPRFRKPRNRHLTPRTRRAQFSPPGHVFPTINVCNAATRIEFSAVVHNTRFAHTCTAARVRRTVSQQQLLPRRAPRSILVRTQSTTCAARETTAAAAACTHITHVAHIAHIAHMRVRA